jgi:FAD/FMN-containing dehydrogenase
VLEAEAGAKLIDLDLYARERGWELRLWPSTKRTATIGGFVAGGGAGVGGIAHGTLRERGNLLGVRVATLQDPPALIDLEGDAASPVNRTYGTTGVITRVRLPLTPAQAWRDVAFSELDWTFRGARLRMGIPVGHHHAWMVRMADWKYVHWSTGMPPQLFDLRADPEEFFDLGQSPEHEAVRAAMKERLLAWFGSLKRRTTITWEQAEAGTDSYKKAGVFYGQW